MNSEGKIYTNVPTANSYAVFACILVVYFYNVIFYMVIIHLAIDTFRCLSPPCKGWLLYRRYDHLQVTISPFEMQRKRHPNFKFQIRLQVITFSADIESGQAQALSAEGISCICFSWLVCDLRTYRHALLPHPFKVPRNDSAWHQNDGRRVTYYLLHSENTAYLYDLYYTATDLWKEWVDNRGYCSHRNVKIVLKTLHKLSEISN